MVQQANAVTKLSYSAEVCMEESASIDKLRIFPMQAILTLFSFWKIPVLCLHYLYPDGYNHKSHCLPKVMSFQVCFSYIQEAFILASVYLEINKVLFENFYVEEVLKWINIFLVFPNI